jgi:Flp pilus assembly pilin Flp
MVEYAIIAAIVAAVALIAVRGLGTSVTGLFQKAETCVTQAQSPSGNC